MPSSSSFSEQKTNGLKASSPLRSAAAKLDQKRSNILSNGNWKINQGPEIPEMVYVKEFRSKVTTMKASDLTRLNSLKTVPQTTTGKKLNQQLVYYRFKLIYIDFIGQ